MKFIEQAESPWSPSSFNGKNDRLLIYRPEFDSFRGAKCCGKTTNSAGSGCLLGLGGDQGLVEEGRNLLLASHDLAETAGERGTGWTGVAEVRTETGSVGSGDRPAEA